MVSYINQPSTNVNARNGSPRTVLRSSAAIERLDLSNNSQRRQNYGSVQVTQSPGGHLIELNDTIGSQRIMIRHSNGSGIEFRPDGSLLISATNIIFDTRGNGSFVVNGRMDMKVDGALVLDASSISMKSGGILAMEYDNMIEIGRQTKFSKLGGSLITKVGGSLQSSVVGPTINTLLGGLDQNVKGNTKYRHDGDVGFFSSGAILITGSDRIVVSSNDVSITGDTLNAKGKSGSIGGADIDLYGHQGIFNGSVHAKQTVETQTLNAVLTVNAVSMNATTFHGDLDGTSSTAIALGGAVTNSAPADAATDASSNSTGTEVIGGITSINTGDWNTAQDDGLKGPDGIRIVGIDPGDYIKNAILGGQL